MAHKCTDGRSSCLCADQQGLDAGAARICPGAHGITSPKATAVAGNADRAVEANIPGSTFREVMKHSSCSRENQRGGTSASLRFCLLGFRAAQPAVQFFFELLKVYRFREAGPAP